MKGDKRALFLSIVSLGVQLLELKWGKKIIKLLVCVSCHLFMLKFLLRNWKVTLQADTNLLFHIAFSNDQSVCANPADSK